MFSLRRVSITKKNFTYTVEKEVIFRMFFPNPKRSLIITCTEAAVQKANKQIKHNPSNWTINKSLSKNHRTGAPSLSCVCRRRFLQQLETLTCWCAVILLWLKKTGQERERRCPSGRSDETGSACSAVFLSDIPWMDDELAISGLVWG